MGKYGRDYYDWGSLPNKDMVTPDLFNSGYQVDNSPGMQQIVYNVHGDRDGTENFLLTGLEFSYVTGTLWDYTSGAAFLSGQIEYIDAGNDVSLTTATGYAYLKHDGTIVSSTSMDVAGCLIGEFSGSVFTDLRNGRRDKNGKYVEYSTEHQYFHGEVEIDKEVKINDNVDIDGTLYVTGTSTLQGDTNIKGSLDVDTNLNVDGNSVIDGTLYVTGQTTLNIVSTLGINTIATDVKICWTDADTFIQGNATSIIIDGDDNVNLLANTEIDITAPLIDINGAVTISSTLTIDSTIEMVTSQKIFWVDTNTYINGTATAITIDGDDNINLLADTEIDLTAPAIDINGVVNISSNTLINGNLTMGSGKYISTPDDQGVYFGGTSGEYARIYHISGTSDDLYVKTFGDGRVIIDGVDGVNLNDNSAQVLTASTGFFILASGTNIYSSETYNDTTASAANIYVASDGRFYRSTSTKNIKKDIIDIKFDEIVFDSLRPVEFKEDESKTHNQSFNKTYIGFIAEEIAKTSPNLALYDTLKEDVKDKRGESTVSKLIGWDTSKVIGYDANGILAYTVSAVQKSRKVIQMMDKKIKDLEIRIMLLENTE